MGYSHRENEIQNRKSFIHQIKHSIILKSLLIFRGNIKNIHNALVATDHMKITKTENHVE